MKRNLLTLIWIFLGFVAYGQVTTSAMNGQVVDADNVPLIGATVVATHLPSGSVYGNTTNVDGFYRIPNMKVGGPYKVEVTYLGYQTYTKEGIFLQLGQTYRINVEMSTDAVTLTDVEIIADRNSIFDGNRTGAETTITEEQISTLPTVSRSVADFTRLTPQSTASEGNDGFEISFAGMNNRYNSLSIDGAINNDVFGLAGSGTNGGQTGVSPISVDAIETFQVSLAPFDVRLGGFAGASINAITRSGTNNWEGSVYGFYRDQNFIRDTFNNTGVSDFTAQTSGFRIGGPIIKDKLFFFLNAEIQREVTPLPFNEDDYIGDARDSIGFLVDKLMNDYGYDPGTFTNNERFLNSDKITFKFDYNLSKNHKVSLRHGYVAARNLEGVQSNSRNIRFLNSSEFFNSVTNSTALELNSVLGSTMSNNLVLSYTNVNDDRDPYQTPFPYVEINDGSGTITFGSERFSTANLLQQNIFSLRNNFELYKGKHTFLVGGSVEYYDIANLFLAFNYGEYEYANFNDFYNNRAPVFYQRVYSLVDNVSGDDSEAIAEFQTTQLGLYLQDEYQVNNNFKVTAGVRFDLPFYGNTPTNEDFNENTIPLLEEAGYDLGGATVGAFIRPNLQVSPRIGFNFDVFGDQKTQLRGGTGIFTSRAPLVWVGGAYNNYGLNAGYTASFINPVSEFNPDIQTQSPGPVDLENTTPSGSIDLFANDFKLPQFWRTNIALDQQLPLGLIANLDFMYTKTLQNVAYQNVNLKPSVTRLTGTPDDRLYYDRRDEVDPTYARIMLGYNTNQGYSYNATASVSRPFKRGWTTTLAYSYGDAYSVFDGTSSQNSSQWRGLNTVDGRNVDQPLTRSDFAAGHRVIFNVAKRFEWTKNIATTVGIFHEISQGSPYSYIYNDNGRLTNEDSRERSLIYIPETSSDIILVGDPDGLSAEEQWAALDAAIEADPYLSQNRGGYAENNASWGRWANVTDLKLIQDFSINAGGKRHTFQFTADIFNFTNLLNKNWGLRSFYPSDVQFINFEGFEVDSEGNSTLTPTFSFNPNLLVGEDNDLFRDLDENRLEPFYDDSGIQSSRWQAQIGLRYIFE